MLSSGLEDSHKLVAWSNTHHPHCSGIGSHFLNEFARLNFQVLFLLVLSYGELVVYLAFSPTFHSHSVIQSLSPFTFSPSLVLVPVTHH